MNVLSFRTHEPKSSFIVCMCVHESILTIDKETQVGMRQITRNCNVRANGYTMFIVCLIVIPTTGAGADAHELARAAAGSANDAGADWATNTRHPVHT